MKHKYYFAPSFLILLALSIIFSNCGEQKRDQEEWISLFNGKDLTGWTPNEHPESFTVEDGKIKAVGERSHLFYTGEVANANFKNFELQLDVMTTHLANSGIYIHTEFQEEGWPSKGYEAQVNTSHIGGGDYIELKKGGSLYSVRNTYKTLTKDDEWSHYVIRVQGNHMQITVNGMKIVDYHQPEHPIRSEHYNQTLSSGTFAFQCHDPESRVYYKDIMVKLLNEDPTPITNEVILNDTYKKMMGYQSNQFSFTDMNIPADAQFDLSAAMQFYYRTGINLGVVSHAESADEAQDFVNTYSPYPIFYGIKANENLSPEAIEPFDYVIGEIQNENAGDAYIDALVDELNNSRINIWSKATVLPGSIDQEKDDFWTEERMMKVITAAKDNNIAIEIDNKLKLPSIAFLKLAKNNGCKFTYSNLGIDTKMGELDYIFEVIEQCKLNYKDIYIPN